MTLLTTIQEAAEEIGLKAPASAVGSSDSTAKRFRRAAEAVAEELLEEHDWSVLQKRDTISSTGATTYSLASDFHRGIPDSTWNSDDKWPIVGNVLRARWERRLNGWVASTNINAAFKIVSVAGEKKIQFDPAPASGDDIIFPYISNEMFDTGATQTSMWSADGYTCLLSEKLIQRGIVWRILRSVGRAYADQKAEYERLKRLHIAHDAPAESIALGGTEWAIAAITPETGYGGV